MDIKTSEERSKNMAAIKSKNTKPEVKLRKALFKLGLRYRINYRLAGKPDIVFLSAKIAIFVDGCFWHGCPKCYRKPESNAEFWDKKITGNIQRDEKINIILANEGWNVLRFWEHEIKKNTNEIAKFIFNTVKNNGLQLRPKK